MLPDTAGKGVFTYQQKAVQSSPVVRRNSLLVNKSSKTTEPKFMGRPIYQPYGQTTPQRNDLNVENSIPNQGRFDFQPPPPKFV